MNNSRQIGLPLEEPSAEKFHAAFRRFLSLLPEFNRIQICNHIKNGRVEDQSLLTRLSKELGRSPQSLKDEIVKLYKSRFPESSYEDDRETIEHYLYHTNPDTASDICFEINYKIAEDSLPKNHTLQSPEKL